MQQGGTAWQYNSEEHRSHRERAQGWGDYEGLLDRGGKLLRHARKGVKAGADLGSVDACLQDAQECFRAAADIEGSDSRALVCTPAACSALLWGLMGHHLVPGRFPSLLLPYSSPPTCSSCPCVAIACSLDGHKLCLVMRPRCALCVKRACHELFICACLAGRLHATPCKS